MTEQELTYNINQELRCCASGFHSIHESRLNIFAFIKEAGYISLHSLDKLIGIKSLEQWAKANGYAKIMPHKKRPDLVIGNENESAESITHTIKNN